MLTLIYKHNKWNQIFTYMYVHDFSLFKIELLCNIYHLSRFLLGGGLFLFFRDFVLSIFFDGCFLLDCFPFLLFFLELSSDSELDESEIMMGKDKEHQNHIINLN